MAKKKSVKSVPLCEAGAAYGWPATPAAEVVKPIVLAGESLLATLVSCLTTNLWRQPEGSREMARMACLEKATALERSLEENFRPIGVRKDGVRVETDRYTWQSYNLDTETNALSHSANRAAVGLVDGLREDLTTPGQIERLMTLEQELRETIQQIKSRHLSGLVAGTEESAPDWEFLPGRFRYKDKWHNLNGNSLKLLMAFVNARQHILTHDQINDACSEGGGDRPHAYVSELNSRLPKDWTARETKPVVPVPGAKAYRFTPPKS
jgi:hypothetical protein